MSDSGSVLYDKGLLVFLFVLVACALVGIFVVTIFVTGLARLTYISNGRRERPGITTELMSFQLLSARAWRPVSCSWRYLFEAATWIGKYSLHRTWQPLAPIAISSSQNLTIMSTTSAINRDQPCLSSPRV
jgi:hypothetical protein